MTRHLEAGEIHAWLDGELDATLGEDAAAARLHVERCSECRARIDEERALRDRASALLDDAAPAVGPLPSLEALRERARAAPSGEAAPPSPLEPYRRWAWAASVVLALGVGWGVRDQAGPWFRGPDSPGDPGPAAPAVSEPGPEAAGEQAAEEAVDRDGEAEMPGEAGVSGPATPVAGPDAAPATDASTGAGARTGMGGPSGTDAPAEARARVGADAPSAGAGPSDDAARSGARGPTPESAGPEIAPTSFRAMRAQDGAEEGAELPPPPSDTGAAPVVAGADAAAGPPEVGLSVPGLDVLSVAWIELEPGGRALRILQRLEPADTLELVVLPASPDDAATGVALARLLEAPVPAGWSRIVRVRDGARIIARAPLSEEALSRLLEDVGRR